MLRDGSVTPGQHASFLGKAFDPFFIGQDPNRPDFRLPELSLPSSLSLDRLDDRRGLQRLIDQQTDLASWSETARGIDAFYSRALTMLSSPKVKRAFDLSEEPDQLRDAYGRTTYGQSCLLARRLVEAGVRFVSVYFSQSIGGKGNGGWDTHGDNFNQLKKRLLPITDQAVPTLIEDLQARGLLDETLVVWMGEFGRTPEGREHQASSAPTAATTGPIATRSSSPAAASSPGAIYGSSDRIGAYPATDPVSPDDIAATMFWALGIDPATEVIDTLGRPCPSPPASRSRGCLDSCETGFFFRTSHRTWHGLPGYEFCCGTAFQAVGISTGRMPVLLEAFPLHQVQLGWAFQAVNSVVARPSRPWVFPRAGCPCHLRCSRVFLLVSVAGLTNGHGYLRRFAASLGQTTNSPP